MKLTGKLIAAGMGLLVAALLSSLAAMTPTSVEEVAGNTTLHVEGSPVQVTLADLIGGVSGGVSSLNVTLMNLGPANVTVIYLARSGEGYSGTRLPLTVHSNVTLAGRSLLDTIVVEARGSSTVYIEATATVIKRGLVGLGVAGLALFIAGTVLVSVGIALRFSGLEAD